MLLATSGVEEGDKRLEELAAVLSSMGKGAPRVWWRDVVCRLVHSLPPTHRSSSL